MNTPYTYLRLSVTDRCNLNCFYCRPAARDNFLKGDELLDLREISILAKRLVGSGIRHVRLTGGEPLLRPQLADLAKELSHLPGLKMLSLTTNGLRLGEAAEALKKSGINKINISLDTLRSDRFTRLTGNDRFSEVLDSVFKALAMGFAQIKLNCLVMKGFNDDELLDFAAFGLENKIDVRFIEFFPTGGRCDSAQQAFFATSETRKNIEDVYGAMEFLGADRFSGPAQYFRIKDAASRIGFISSVSDFFCGSCNRLRLTADGKLYPCLHSAHHADLRQPLRQGDEEALSGLIERITVNKKLFNKAFCSRSFEMSAVGG
ncbi:MAG TPA: GTP 3',8-cyclase MoaA [Candidatus Omnitrophica bacterium]|nr:GTP 3',8-cyclase MoaA [Candidatus Omnitrophota bacterium]